MPYAAWRRLAYPGFKQRSYEDSDDAVNLIYEAGLLLLNHSTKVRLWRLVALHCQKTMLQLGTDAPVRLTQEPALLKASMPSLCRDRTDTAYLKNGIDLQGHLSFIDALQGRTRRTSQESRECCPQHECLLSRGQHLNLQADTLMHPTFLHWTRSQQNVRANLHIWVCKVKSRATMGESPVNSLPNYIIRPGRSSVHVHARHVYVPRRQPKAHVFKVAFKSSNAGSFLTLSSWMDIKHRQMKTKKRSRSTRLSIEYCHRNGAFTDWSALSRPLSFTMASPKKSASRRAVVVAHDFFSPYSARDLLMVFASEMYSKSSSSATSMP
eukprot:SM000372S13695  [mRNA]  locus=s372:8069:13109:- [translate_table: standard]